MKPLIAIIILLTALITGLYFYNLTKAVTIIPPWSTDIASIPDLNRYFQINSLKITEKNNVKTWDIKVDKANSAIIQKYVKSLESSGFVFDTSENVGGGIIRETYKRDRYIVALTYNATVDEGSLIVNIVLQ